LDITFTHYTDVSYDFDGSGTKHVVLVVRQSLGWGNDDRVSSVRTQGVKVLHVAADDDVLRSVHSTNGDLHPQHP